MSPANKSKPLIPYIRQSRKRERTISLEDQERLVKQWATAHGAKLTDKVVEQGVSGSKPWRERELGDAIARCERGEASGVIVAYQSRLSRESGAATAEVYTALEAAGVRLVCVNEGIDTADPSRDRDDTELFFSINAAIARREWKRSRKNFAVAREQAVLKSGVHPSAHVPVGYVKPVIKHDERTERPVYGPLEVDPVAGPAVSHAYRLRAQGASWREIGDALQAAGVEPRGHNGNGASRYWTPSALAKVLANPVYLGTAWTTFAGERFEKPDAHPPLVDSETFRRANRPPTTKYSRRGRTADGALLAGLTYCGSCGGRLVPNLGKHGRYRCREYRLCSAPASASADVLEKLVQEAVLSDAFTGPLTRERVETPDFTALDSEVLRARTSYERWLEREEDMADDPAAWNTRRKSLKENVEEAEAALHNAHLRAGAVEQGRQLPQLWESLTVPERRRALQAHGVRVTVWRKGTSPEQAAEVPEWANAWVEEATERDTPEARKGRELLDRSLIEWTVPRED